LFFCQSHQVLWALKFYVMYGKHILRGERGCLPKFNHDSRVTIIQLNGEEKKHMQDIPSQVHGKTQDYMSYIFYVSLLITNKVV
jgi:hypothetical protein